MLKFADKNIPPDTENRPNEPFHPWDVSLKDSCPLHCSTPSATLSRRYWCSLNPLPLPRSKFQDIKIVHYQNEYVRNAEMWSCQTGKGTVYRLCWNTKLYRKVMCAFSAKLGIWPFNWPTNGRDFPEQNLWKGYPYPFPTLWERKRKDAWPRFSQVAVFKFYHVFLFSSIAKLPTFLNFNL